MPPPAGALDANSRQLSGLIGSVYGPVAGRRFRALWQEHIDEVLAYARATAANDEEGKQAALTELNGYLQTFVDFMASANPYIDPQAEAVSLQMHVSQLLQFASSDYSAVYDSERQAFVHMFGFGDQLAQAIARQFPRRFTGARALSPGALLRMTLDRLLAEHAVLAASAMRAGLTEAPDKAAVASALDANGRDLTSAIGLVYGADTAAAFSRIWSEHVAAYLAYVDAVRTHDRAGRKRTVADLDRLAGRLASALAKANPGLASPAVAAMLRHHMESLIEQVDADAAGDYPRAVASVNQAYNHMFLVGDAVAAAISRQFPNRFRDITTMPPTSTVDAPPDPWLPGLGFIPGGLLCLLAARLLRPKRAVARPGGGPS